MNEAHKIGKAFYEKDKEIEYRRQENKVLNERIAELEESFAFINGEHARAIKLLSDAKKHIHFNYNCEECQKEMGKEVIELKERHEHIKKQYFRLRDEFLIEEQIREDYEEKYNSCVCKDHRDLEKLKKLKREDGIPPITKVMGILPTILCYNRPCKKNYNKKLKECPECGYPNMDY